MTVRLKPDTTSARLAYTGHLMSRLWGLAFALAITGAPLAPAVCVVTCAAHDMASSSSTAQHHSCHESSSSGATAIHVPHACGHDHARTIAPQELIRILVSVGLAETPVVAIARLDLAMDVVSPAHVEHSPPGLAALTTPLRV